MSAPHAACAVRVMLPVVICGIVGYALHASVSAGPQQAAANTPRVASAAVTSEMADMPQAFVVQSHGSFPGNDARQDAALAVLLVLAVATRSDGERGNGARQQRYEVGLPGRQAGRIRSSGVSRRAP